MLLSFGCLAGRKGRSLLCFACLAGREGGGGGVDLSCSRLRLFIFSELPWWRIICWKMY